MRKSKFSEVQITANDPKDEPLLMRIAAWALRDDDTVIGLVGLYPGAWKALHKDPRVTEILAEAPGETIGHYKHITDFSSRELGKLKNLGPQAAAQA